MTGTCRIAASAAWNGEGSVSVWHSFGRLSDDVGSHLGSADKLVSRDQGSATSALRPECT
jgi:hypothetical protein